GTREFKASGRWNILQALPVSGFCDFDDEVDPNTINEDIADFGGFLTSQPAQPQSVALVGIADSRIAEVPVSLHPDFSSIPIFRGTPLLRGELGSNDVKILQGRLNDLGFGRLVVDGDFGEGTENAVVHFQARNSTSDGKPLAIDGQVGATTWAALFGP